jgi:zinc transport system ATP-binding protein
MEARAGVERQASQASPGRSPGVPAIEVRDVWLSFRGTNALEAIDLTVEQGALLGIIGPNGAGKTVLLKVLLGLLKPDRGSVRILGKPAEKARGEVAYVPQHAEFDRNFPVRVRDVVLMGRLGRGKLFRPYDATDRRRVREAIERVGLSELADRQIGKLSGGQLQRALIARALAVDARILLLDEPTANLDSQVAGRLYDLLHRLSGELTIVLVDHDIGVMHRYVESVGCLNRRLHYHAAKLTQQALEQTYGYPVEVVVHGAAQRILDDHETQGEG